jgi:hypothetical protein
MPEYHMRRSEKAMTDPQELVDVNPGTEVHDAGPLWRRRALLVTMNYGFDAEASCSTSTAQVRGRSSTS